MKYSDLFDAYYILNALLIFAYPLTRIFLFHNNPILEFRDELGYKREIQVLGSLAMIIVLKFFRKNTIEEYLSSVILYCKVTAIMLYFFINVKVALMYIAGSSLVWLLANPPKYKGPSNMLEIQTPEEFKKLIKNRKGEKGSYSKMQMSFVEYYANFADNCRTVYFLNQLKGIWAEFSMKYSTKRVQFFQGVFVKKVNVEKFPQIAKDENINTTAFSRQLPSLVLYENGEETLRFPPINEKGKVAKVLKYDRKELARYFDFERRYLATKEI